MTQNKKHGLLPDKKYLFVLLATKSCQLKFEDLLIYSFLMYRAGTTHPTVAQRRIADNLGFCRTTVRQSLRTLEELVLVGKTNEGRWYGVDPKEKSAWFVTIKKVNTAGWQWYKRFASFRMCIPRPKRMMPPENHPSPNDGNGQAKPADSSLPIGGNGTPSGTKAENCLTPRENAVLWKIHSWNTGRFLMTVTHQGIATQLCLHRETVCRVIKQLKNKKLLDDDLQATIKDGQHHYWLEAPKKLRRNPKTAAPSSLADTVTSWYKSRNGQFVYFPDAKKLGSMLNRYEEVMREAGYNSSDLLNYWQTTAYTYCRGNPRYLECFILNGFLTVFQVTEEIHAAKGMGYRNSLGLLKRKTEGVIHSIQKRYEGRPRIDYDPLLDWEPDFGELRYGGGQSGR
jgi:hypothetical protein